MKIFPMLAVFVAVLLAVPLSAAYSPFDAQCNANNPVLEPEAFGNNIFSFFLDCPKKSGTCTPGTVRCDEFITRSDTGACEYTCNAAGKWDATKRCPKAFCNGINQCM